MVGLHFKIDHSKQITKCRKLLFKINCFGGVSVFYCFSCFQHNSIRSFGIISPFSYNLLILQTVA